MKQQERKERSGAAEGIKEPRMKPLSRFQIVALEDLVKNPGKRIYAKFYSNVTWARPGEIDRAFFTAGAPCRHGTSRLVEGLIARGCLVEAEPEKKYASTYPAYTAYTISDAGRAEIDRLAKKKRKFCEALSR